MDIDGSMSIQKHELFTAVKEMNWQGNVRLLWKGLDRDMSGITSLLELDLRSAYQLARFKEFCTEQFGTVVQFFTAIDTQKKFKLTRDDFLEACRKHGYKKATPSLYHGLDWKGNKYIRVADVAFLDAWRCPLYLTCKANAEAAREFKEALLRIYKSFTKAWRHCLDRDNSNCVAWEEFEDAGRKIHFKGDLPGAWRFLDYDMNGSISLQEIDAQSSDCFLGFKRWADEEFGGIRSAFSVLDCDGTGALNRREFRKAMSAYGYQGDIKHLFEALDVDGQGILTLTEVIFLADWEIDQITENDLKGEVPDDSADKTKTVQTIQACPPRITELARCKSRGPEKPGGSVCSGKVPDGDSSWILNPKQHKLKKLHKCYGQIPENEFPSPPTVDVKATKIEAMKDEILSLPMIDINPVFGGLNSALDADMASVRRRTIALRDRTVKLLSKAEDSDREMFEMWSAVPAESRLKAPGSKSKVCKLPAIV